MKKKEVKDKITRQGQSSTTVRKRETQRVTLSSTSMLHESNNWHMRVDLGTK